MSNSIDLVTKVIQNICVDIQNKIFTQYNSEQSKQILQKCDEIVEQNIKNSSDIKQIISSYNHQFKTINDNSNYILAYNPIDNLNLLSLAFSVGSIFTVYKNTIAKENIVYCAYATYGPTFQFVSAIPNKKVEFLSYKDGEFIYNTDITLENKGKINSTAGDVSTFGQPHKNLMKSFFDEGYRLRFSGSLSLDTHQILFKRGGLYSSVSTKENKKGTHSLVFELYSIAHIVELCGGEAIDDNGVKIIDKCLDNIEEKSPVYFGSNYEIAKVKATL